MSRNIVEHWTLVCWLSIVTLVTANPCFAENSAASSARNQETHVYRIWPDGAPNWKGPTKPEQDTSGPESRQVAGRRVVRLGFVSEPQLHVYLPADEMDSEAAVVICPGGGYSILAWDLEGTEIAEWLSGIGITAAVLKYRVPSRSNEPRWLPPVQDIQRSISMLRSGVVEGVEPKQVGVLGFSAGGNAAVRAATATERHYDAIDASDEASFSPDFGILVYPAWLVKEDQPNELIDEIQVTEETPPMFFAHARDDRVSCMSSVTMFTELYKKDIPAALHVFSGGGHGFGARPTGMEHDAWPGLCESWLRDGGWLKR